MGHASFLTGDGINQKLVSHVLQINAAYASSAFYLMQHTSSLFANLFIFPRTSPLNIYPSFRGLLAPFTRPKLEHVSEKSSLWLFSFSRRSVPSILTDNHQINVIRRVMEIKYFSRLETILPSFATDPFGSRRIFRIHKDSKR